MFVVPDDMQKDTVKSQKPDENNQNKGFTTGLVVVFVHCTY